MATIAHSVGKWGKNHHADVMLVQTLLNLHIGGDVRLHKWLKPFSFNGRINGSSDADPTVTAIIIIQREILGITKPDGRVDPGGRTLKYLEGTSGAWGAGRPTPTASAPVIDPAQQIVNDFAAKTDAGAFKWLDRSTIASGLRARLNNPYLINQGQSGLCPSAAVVFQIARTKPEAYAQAVTDLFDTGKAKIGKWSLAPCQDLKDHRVPASIAEADWIIMASIRDSENWFIDYESETDRGGAWGNEVAAWMKKAGFTDIKEDWNYFFSKDVGNLVMARHWCAANYQVALLIDADMIDGKLKTLISKPNHWVVLDSKSFVILSKQDPVSFPVYTWGKRITIPRNGTLNLGDFLDMYYGYIACKY
ncbi:hypothetical protein [Vineibacter terrae]|uniref:hypothetical protein n=1 Tax=Vineibacter terrae TaxID=2586908 RepID=UPI002E35FA5C|nr:hypothetical protein [Vineibacter terrae]HEX2887498.1 hypothetical protein [Vineibacter terrae]